MSADTDIILPGEETEQPAPALVEANRRLHAIEEQRADESKVYGAPWLIVASFANPRMRPETFPMMNFDPAVDAARAIYRDGTYYRIAVVNNYTQIEHAIFYRWMAEDGAEVSQEVRRNVG